MDIKIAFTKKGVFHDKFGMFIDKDGDACYFRGSNNETAASVLFNYESFETSLLSNANENEKDKIYKASEVFNRIWNDQCDDLIVIPLPATVKEKILSYGNHLHKSLLEEKDNTLIFDIADKNKFYIFEYDPNESLLNNGGKHFFVKLSNIQKIFVAIFMIIPTASLSVLFKKGPSFYLYALCIAAFFCLTTISYCAILKTPLIEQKRKSLLFVLLSLIICTITSIMGLYCLYGVVL